MEVKLPLVQQKHNCIYTMLNEENDKSSFSWPSYANSALSWTRDGSLASGGRDCHILVRDPRASCDTTAIYDGHRQEVNFVYLSIILL